jgi:predicted nucleic acid-binding protein
VIAMDSSVVVKWFKSGEPNEKESRDLRQRIERQEVRAVVNEILALEVVRGLKKAQTHQPALGILDSDVEDAWLILESMIQTGILEQRRVDHLRNLAKDFVAAYYLGVADALHLATAIDTKARYFVSEDQDLLKSAVVNSVRGLGVEVVNLPSLIAALNASGAGPPSP